MVSYGEMMIDGQLIDNSWLITVSGGSLGELVGDN